MPICAPVLAHLFPQVFEQMIVGLGRVPAKKHVATIMNCGNLHAGIRARTHPNIRAPHPT